MNKILQLFFCDGKFRDEIESQLRYSYEHAPTDHWSFPVLDIDLRRESHVDVVGPKKPHTGRKRGKI